MYNNLKIQQILPYKKLSLKKSLTRKPSIKKPSIKKPSIKKPSIKKPSIKKSINNNKIVTYAVGSSIVRFNKNTITIYTNTEFDYNILYKPDFISKFNIKDYKSSSSNNQLISNKLFYQNLNNNNTINFKTNFKINNINTIQKNNTFTNINAKKNIWTTQIYNYNGNVFMNNTYTTKSTHYYSYTQPNFINNNININNILVHLYDNIYLLISSYKIILFKTPDNDKIIAIKENYTRNHNQNILLIGETYSYYMCVPYPDGYADEKSFYISNENYKKYNMNVVLYPTIVYKTNSTNININTNTNNKTKNNKWSFIYELPIKKKNLGITYYNYKEVKINNVLNELIPLFSMRNHNYMFN